MLGWRSLLGLVVVALAVWVQLVRVVSDEALECETQSAKWQGWLGAAATPSAATPSAPVPGPHPPSATPTASASPTSTPTPGAASGAKAAAPPSPSLACLCLGAVVDDGVLNLSWATMMLVGLLWAAGSCNRRLMLAFLVGPLRLRTITVLEDEPGCARGAGRDQGRGAPTTTGTRSWQVAAQVSLHSRLTGLGGHGVVPSYDGGARGDEWVVGAAQEPVGLLATIGLRWLTHLYTPEGAVVDVCQTTSPTPGETRLTYTVTQPGTRKVLVVGEVGDRDLDRCAARLGYELVAWSRSVDGQSRRRAGATRSPAPSPQSLEHLDNALLAARSRDFDQAIAHARRAIEAGGTDLEARRVLGETQERIGLFLEALHTYTAGLVIMRDDRNTWRSPTRSAVPDGARAAGRRGRAAGRPRAWYLAPRWWPEPRGGRARGTAAQGLLWRYVATMSMGGAWVNRLIALSSESDLSAALDRVHAGVSRPVAGAGAGAGTGAGCTGTSPCVGSPRAQSRSGRPHPWFSASVPETPPDLLGAFDIDEPTARQHARMLVDHARDHEHEQVRMLRGFLAHRHRDLLSREFPLLEATWFAEQVCRMAPLGDAVETARDAAAPAPRPADRGRGPGDGGDARTPGVPGLVLHGMAEWAEALPPRPGRLRPRLPAPDGRARVPLADGMVLLHDVFMALAEITAHVTTQVGSPSGCRCMVSVDGATPSLASHLDRVVRSSLAVTDDGTPGRDDLVRQLKEFAVMSVTTTGDGTSCGAGDAVRSEELDRVRAGTDPLMVETARRLVATTVSRPVLAHVVTRLMHQVTYTVDDTYVHLGSPGPGERRDKAGCCRAMRALLDRHRGRFADLAAQLDLHLFVARAALDETAMVVARRSDTAPLGPAPLQRMLWTATRQRYVRRVLTLHRHFQPSGGPARWRVDVQDRVAADTVRQAMRACSYPAHLRWRVLARAGVKGYRHLRPWNLTYYGACVLSSVIDSAPDDIWSTTQASDATGRGLVRTPAQYRAYTAWCQAHDRVAWRAVQALDSVAVQRVRGAWAGNGVHDWIVFEDPALDQLRRHPRFRRWASAYYNVPVYDETRSRGMRRLRGAAEALFRLDGGFAVTNAYGVLGHAHPWSYQQRQWRIVQSHHMTTLCQGLLPKARLRMLGLAEKLEKADEFDRTTWDELRGVVSAATRFWHALAAYPHVLVDPSVQLRLATALREIADEDRDVLRPYPRTHEALELGYGFVPRDLARAVSPRAAQALETLQQVDTLSLDPWDESSRRVIVEVLNSALADLKQVPELLRQGSAR